MLTLHPFTAQSVMPIGWALNLTVRPDMDEGHRTLHSCIGCHCHCTPHATPRTQPHA